MLTGVAAYVIIVFLIAVILTYQLFISAVKNKKTTAVTIFIWLALTGALAYKGFFTQTSAMPPRLAMAVLPALVFVVILLLHNKSQSFINNLDLRKLTLLHIVRVPVEIALYGLAAGKFIPDLMTFEGRNFDIIAGITAPVVYFICFDGGQVKRPRLLLVWNFICLALLLNIVINAVLAAPFPFQQFAFDQPNIAVLYFPYVWLPVFIVMLVLFSHLIVIKRLLKNKPQ